MRKLNGITINGEYLGNSVVINGMFRAICTISPVIMRDFVLIINKIDKLEDAVKIHNFNCGFDCIDIEFENNTSKGMASLYFKLHNGEPLLRDCKLVIDDEEYSTFQDKIELHSKNDMTNPNKPVGQQPVETQNSELDRLQKIRELREKKQAMQKKQQAGGNNNTSSKANANLSPEELREQKRKELLEKKRRLLEAKKAKSGGDGSQDSSTDNAQKISSIVMNEDGTITNEKGQPVVKEERINPDGSISEVYVNPENPSEVYEQNENGEFVSYGSGESGDGDTGEDTSYNTSKGSILDNLSDEDLENMSDEELAALEAELNAELDNEGLDDYADNSRSSNQDYNLNGFAEKLSQELVQGLTEGLTQGLSQGLAQGFSQGFGNIGNSGNFAGNSGFTPNENFGNNSFDNNFNGAPPSFDGNSFGNNFNPGNQNFSQPITQQAMPDYSQIDNLNYNASMSAKDNYSYDVNSNLDDISDFYSNFYEEAKNNNNAQINGTNSQTYGNQPASELDALKAELDALKAQANPEKQLMTLEEFMARQKEIEEAKQKISRQKLKIVGSKERINANALDGGVFVAGKKVYKWGNPRVLDE